MASKTKQTETVRRWKRAKVGQTRKRALRNKGSTPPRAAIVPPEK
jgi:hypothetical protein